MGLQENMPASIEEIATEGAELQGGLQPDAASGQPFSEIGTNRPDVDAGVRDALETLAVCPGRDAGGRFTAGNVAAGGTLERSAAFWAAVDPAKRELAAKVRSDLAAADDAPQTLLGLTDAYAEVRLFRSAMFVRLVEQGGPITAKGKARALYTAYLGALDREMKLAQQLGLERRSKPVQSLAEILAAHEERS
jgi:hypothetical protein